MAQPNSDHDLYKKLQQLVHISHYLHDTLITPSMSANVDANEMNYGDNKNPETHTVDKMTQTDEIQSLQPVIQPEAKQNPKPLGDLDHEAERISGQTRAFKLDVSDTIEHDTDTNIHTQIQRDEVRKQKENWQKMINEVKEEKAKLERREAELQINDNKLLEVHETLAALKKLLHKKAKKIKARER
eukprot:360534_1